MAAKVHFQVGPFGAAACGKENVDTDTDTSHVTCVACGNTQAFLDAKGGMEDHQAMTMGHPPAGPGDTVAGYEPQHGTDWGDLG